MSHPNSVLQQANALGPLLEKRNMSRRTLLRNMAGLALTGGSLTQLATACGLVPGASASSSAQGRTIFIYHSQSGAAAWSPNGKRIASGNDDGTVQVWDALTGTHVFTYRGHPKVINTLAWSPDSKRIASGSDDKTVQVWDE